MTTPASDSVVEIKPEVVFLYEILQELTRQRIKIPRFQRAFVWRPDQMTDLLDSIHKQYPIGSLLVWETDEPIATLDRLGPFTPVGPAKSTVGYLLDGHQRLMTLASALLPGTESLQRAAPGLDGGRWEMYWNTDKRRFQHRSYGDSTDLLFPMTSLLDTILFFESVETVKQRLGAGADSVIAEVSALARTFQSYRVPVIRMRQTGLSEAVEIFARLNSKGQSMTADQMVSALTFRQGDRDVDFDLATEIDRMQEALGEQLFGDIDRNTILRAVLANLGEDIYRTDWTRLAGDRRDALQARLADAVVRTNRSLEHAVGFLTELGVRTSRLLPYGLQLVLLSAFFDRCPEPTVPQQEVLERWFWVSSFSAWFGGANPSRISVLIDEFRGRLATDASPAGLATFDLTAEALPYPLNFDMRSARARTLLLVMLSRNPSSGGLSYVDEAVEMLAASGPSAVGSVFPSPPPEVRGNPANRLFRPPEVPRGPLGAWVLERQDDGDSAALEAACIDDAALEALHAADAGAFVRARQRLLTEYETEFQLAHGVTPSQVGASVSPVDTD